MMRKIMLLSLMTALFIAGSVYALPTPAGHWPLDGDAADISGNGYTATFGGGETQGIEGVYGAGVKFNPNTDSWMDVPLEVWNDHVEDTQQYTICFWYKLEQADLANNVILAASSSGSRELQSHLPWTNGTIYFDDGGRDTTNYANAGGVYGEWQHWTYQRNPATGHKQLWLNGTPIMTDNRTAALNVKTSFVFGSNQAHTTNSAAAVDDIRIYDVILTDDEVQEVMDGGGLTNRGAHTPAPSGLVESRQVPVTEVTWEDPLLQTDPEGDPNLVSVDQYDITWYILDNDDIGADDPNWVTSGTTVTGVTSPYNDGGTLSVTNEQTMFWRVDTHVTVDSNEITETADTTLFVEGGNWSFETEPSWTPPALAMGDTVLTTLTILAGEDAVLTGTVTGNSHPILLPTWTPITPGGVVSVDVSASVPPDYGYINPEATFTAAAAGDYLVQLTITDGTGQTNDDGDDDTEIGTIGIHVLDNDCEAAKIAVALGWDPNEFDFDESCLVDLPDFAVVSASWLDDTGLLAQETYLGNDYGSIVFEGENYDFKRGDQVADANFILTIDADNASNGEYMFIGVNTTYGNFDQATLDNAPRMDYTVNIETAGTYYIWMRGFDDGGNSFHFGVDGQISQNALGQDLRVTGNGDWNWWNNIQGGATADILLTAGEHTINIYQREDECGLDKFLLSPDPDYVPMGIGPDETP